MSFLKSSAFELGASAIFPKAHFKNNINDADGESNVYPMGTISYVCKPTGRLSYGVGIFTPILIAAMIGTHGAGLNFIAQDFYSTEYTVLLDVFLVIGFVLNILFIERIGRIRLQLAGFIGMAAGMFILSQSQSGSQTITALAFLGFGLFNLLQN